MVNQSSDFRIKGGSGKLLEVLQYTVKSFNWSTVS